MQTSDEEIQKLREHILAEIDLTREMSDTEIRAIVSEKCSIYGKQKFLKLSEQEALEQYLFHSLRKLDVLQELLDDPEITEIMVNGAEHIFYEKRGQLFESDKHFTSKEKLNDVIQQMAGSNNRMVNEASPIVDTRLADGSRVNIVLEPVAIDGSVVTIRKFPENLTGNLIYRFQYAIQKFFLCEFSPFNPCQLRFPAGGEGGVSHFHSAYRFI